MATETTLDHIDGIKVPGEPFAEPANEYWALVCLWNGMEFLYSKAHGIDEMGRKSLNPEGKFKLVLSSNISGLSPVDQSLLTCSYHWYAVSACNYARIIGAIAYQSDNTRPLPPAYIEQVIPEVLTFRDKVGAHFAWSTQNKRDNDAERLASIFPQLNWVNDSFTMGAVGASVTRGGKSSTSSAIKSWSLTKVHEQLRLRYWPHLAARASGVTNATQSEPSPAE